MQQIHVHSAPKRFALRLLLPLVDLLIPLFSSSQKLEAGASLRRILVFRPDHIGDAIMASAVLAPLRQRYPEAHLALCVGPWAASLFRGHPLLDELIVATLPWWSKIRNSDTSEAPGLGWFALWWRLRRNPVDLFLDLRSDLRHILLYGVLARAKHIVAYDRSGGVRCLSAAVPYDPGEHEVRKNVRLLEALGIHVANPALSIPNDLRAGTVIEEKLRQTDGTAAHRLITLCPQTRLRVKEWPVASWIGLVKALHKLFPDVRFFIVGDRQLVFPLPAELSSVATVWAGQLGLLELNALFARSALVIGSDSAPLHLAACRNVPILCLFGPTRAELFGPFSPRLTIVQGPCDCNRDLHLDCQWAPRQSGKCMRDIAETEVLAVASGLLRPGSGRERPEDRDVRAFRAQTKL